MKKFMVCLFAALAAGSCIPLMALEGEVVAVNGKVEFQSKAGEWKSLKQGDPVTSGTMISTGFKSEATVKLGASVLTIRPLTRMTLTELVEKEDVVDTEVYLEVGNVKAEVNSLNNKKNGFKVKSPVATASVRGTIFEVGEKGLVILRGTVEYSTPVGQTRTGTEGQQLVLVGDSVASPAAALQEKMETIALSTTPSTETKSAVMATSQTTAHAAPVATAANPVPVQTTKPRVTINLD